MKNRVVAISREFGSGGRTIGKKLAEQLGIPCYDSELIHKIAQESGFAEDYVKTTSEDAQTTVMGFALTAYLDGAQQNQNEIVRYELVSMQINYCLGCRQCIENGGVCVQRDDCSEIFEAMKTADLVVMEAPIYIDQMNGIMKKSSTAAILLPMNTTSRSSASVAYIHTV